ncbi:MAG: patatin-like phospholipase family protein [Patescibacteria group bacterium]
MPHEKFGKIGFFLGGGGAKQGLPQAIQLNLFFKAGIKPDVIDAGSVGAFNALYPENSISIWENYVTSPEAIYEFNPAVKKLIVDVKEALPHKTSPPFSIKEPQHWKEIVDDLKIQLYKIFFAYKLLKPLLKSSFYGDTTSIKKAKEAGEPLRRVLTEFIEKREIRKIPAFLDIEPIIKLIFEKINLESLSGYTWETNFLVRSFNTGDITFLKAKNPQEFVPLACASAAIRPLFSPVFVQNEWYCDGIQANPFPVENLFDKCDTIFAFVQNYEIFEPKDNIFKALFFEESNALEKHLFRILKSQAQKRAQKENKKFFIIHPQEPMHKDLGLLSISEEAIKYTKKIETEATEKFLKELLQNKK